MTAPPAGYPGQCRQEGIPPVVGAVIAICILLLAIGALVLQARSHAGPAGLAIHHQQAAATTPFCAGHHLPDMQDAALYAGCASDESGGYPADCCQSCLIVALSVGSPIPAPPLRGEFFMVRYPDPLGRSLESPLRPPRLVAM